MTLWWYSKKPIDTVHISQPPWVQSNLEKVEWRGKWRGKWKISRRTLLDNHLNYFSLLTFGLKGHTFESGFAISKGHSRIKLHFRREWHDPACTLEPCMATRVFQQYKRAGSSVSLTVQRIQGKSESRSTGHLIDFRQNNWPGTSTDSRTNRSNSNVLSCP